jgi:pimeloyl-ACP methyl ester carboxylesterase
MNFTCVTLALLAALVLTSVAPVRAQTPAPTLSAPRTVHVDDVDIAYQELGQGSPVLMITGFSSTMDMWAPKLLQALAAHHRVIVFDSRGLGLSTSSDKAYTIPLFADDAAGLLDALKIDHAAVFGWSMGSFVAQELALRQPQKVDRLILLSGHCGGSEAAPTDPKVAAALVDRSGTPEEAGMRLMGLMFPPDWLKAHPDPRTYFAIPHETSDPRNIGRQGEAIGSWTGTCPRLSTLTIPTLILQGTADAIVPPQNAFIMGQRIPAAWVVQIRDGGHGVMYQYPDEIDAAVLAFLAVGR